MLRIINQRLQKYLAPQILPEQAGFMKSRGTRDQIFNIRQLIEKAREFNIPIFLCFIDHKKAFDYALRRSVDYTEGNGGSKSFGVSYQQSMEATRLLLSLITERQIHSKYREECAKAAFRLFNPYGEYIMRQALKNYDGGVQIKKI